MGVFKDARAVRTGSCAACRRQSCVCRADEDRALRSAMREANAKYMRKHKGGKRACDR